MIPTKISIRDVTSFGQLDLDLTELPHGLICLVGPNGAGKTTLMEAMAPGAMYREFPSRPDRRGLLPWATSRQAHIDVTMEYDGHTYRLLHQLDPEYSGGRGKAEAFLYQDGQCLAEQRARLAERRPGTALPERLGDAALPEAAAIDLDDHPAVRAAAADLLRADAEIAAAEAAFDPGWSWSVGLGQRIGTGPMGAPSDTLLNARLSIDLPLFTERRQSKRLEAARHRHRAAAAGPVETRRALAARRASAEDAAAAFSDLVALYGDRVLPASDAAAEAARGKYRNGSIPLEDVLAAEIEVLDVRHERIEAALERDLARVELAYLGGL